MANDAILARARYTNSSLETQVLAEVDDGDVFERK